MKTQIYDGNSNIIAEYDFFIPINIGDKVCTNVTSNPDEERCFIVHDKYFEVEHNLLKVFSHEY